MSETLSDKERFSASCGRSDEYPKSLVQPATFLHNLTLYHDRLDEASNRLFRPDGKGDIDILEYVDDSKDFQLTSKTSSFEIRGHFEGEHLFEKVDPRCRYIFISAPHSRDILRISRKMLTYMLTYYQVMPAFLDFIFPFGLRERAQDFHFSGFREETYLLPTENSLRIKEIGRSGRSICMCFSLKGIERSHVQSWPWSMRQTSAYHSFDVGAGSALWILVKGNEVVEERIKSANGPDRLSKSDILNEPSKVLRTTFETHLILCEWSAENWRLYLNYLEEVLQDITSRSLAIKIGKNPKAAAEETYQFTTARTLSTIQREGQEFHSLGPTFSTPPLSRVPSYRPTNPQQLGPPPPPNVLPPGRGMPSQEKYPKTDELEGFSFHDLQQVQLIEEKLGEVLLVLDSNTHVLTEMNDYYDSVVKLDEWPRKLAEACTPDVVRFSKRIVSAIKELRMHHARAETMLRLLKERKTLLYGILEYHNTQANMDFTAKAQEFARKAQESANRMEELTIDMHQIAKNTEKETVSMRTITLVALVFLPGTFMSTIMSTDIIKFPITNAQQDSEERVYHSDALILWLEFTIPVTLVVLAIWVVPVYLRRRRKKQDQINEKKKEREKGNA